MSDMVVSLLPLNRLPYVRVAFGVVPTVTGSGVTVIAAVRLGKWGSATDIGAAFAGRGAPGAKASQSGLWAVSNASTTRAIQPRLSC